MTKRSSFWQADRSIRVLLEHRLSLCPNRFSILWHGFAIDRPSRCICLRLHQTSLALKGEERGRHFLFEKCLPSFEWHWPYIQQWEARYRLAPEDLIQEAPRHEKKFDEKQCETILSLRFFFLNALLEWLLIPSFSLNSCCLIRKLNSTMAMENDTKQQICNDFRCISFFGWRRWCTTKMVWIPYKNDLKLLMTREKREFIYVAYEGFIACERRKNSTSRKPIELCKLLEKMKLECRSSWNFDDNKIFHWISSSFSTVMRLYMHFNLDLL